MRSASLPGGCALLALLLLPLHCGVGLAQGLQQLPTLTALVHQRCHMGFGPDGQIVGSGLTSPLHPALPLLDHCCLLQQFGPQGIRLLGQLLAALPQPLVALLLLLILQQGLLGGVGA